MSQRDRVRLDVEEKASKQQETETFSEEGATHDPNANLHSMLQMQRSLGNQAVQRLLGQVQRVPFEEGGELDDDLSSQINSQRGSGGRLEGNVAEGMGQHMDYDFSGVNVHTDANADRLSRSIGARAFTTGNDIFFKEGEYQPASSSGQDLLAHELTHVVQQDGQAPSGKLSVGPADDAYEREADSMADTVSASESTPVQREALPEEEEEMVQAKRDVQREALPEEEEELQMMRDVQREELPEEEELI